MPGPLHRQVIQPPDATLGVNQQRQFNATALDRFGNAVPRLSYLFRSDDRAGHIESEFTTTPDGFVSLMGRLTAFVINTTMALVEDGDVLGSRQLDMGNSGSVSSGRYVFALPSYVQKLTGGLTGKGHFRGTIKNWSC